MLPVAQVENEELVFTLEVLVDKFGDEIAPYAVSLATNLTAAFWKYSGMADGEDGEDEDDQGEALWGTQVRRKGATLVLNG